MRALGFLVKLVSLCICSFSCLINVLKDPVLKKLSACSFCWFVVVESTVRWFVVREKHCWMAADSADMLKQLGSNTLPWSE
jgi:hypothetical protein